MSTSTQFKLRFLAADWAESTPLIVHSVKKPMIHQLVVVHNQDGSIIVQTTAQSQSRNKHSLPTSNQPLMEPEETLRSDHRNRSDCSWCVLWIICAVGVVFYCKHLFSSTVLVSVKKSNTRKCQTVENENETYCPSPSSLHWFPDVFRGFFQSKPLSTESDSENKKSVTPRDERHSSAFHSIDKNVSEKKISRFFYFPVWMVRFFPSVCKLEKSNGEKVSIY